MEFCKKCCKLQWSPRSNKCLLLGYRGWGLSGCSTLVLPLLPPSSSSVFIMGKGGREWRENWVCPHSAGVGGLELPTHLRASPIHPLHHLALVGQTPDWASSAPFPHSEERARSRCGLHQLSPALGMGWHKFMKTFCFGADCCRNEPF